MAVTGTPVQVVASSSAATAGDCAPDCGHEAPAAVFERLRTRPLVGGGTRVEWEMDSRFSDPLPYVFQLQVGRTGLAGADDWENVGLSATDTYYLVDDSQRVYGKTQWSYYRVKLVTDEGTYYSAPANCLGDLSFRDWRLSRAIIRQETVRFRQAAGQEGYLLKQRIAGDKCDACRDYQTDEVVDAQCELCYGTGFTDGYFDPEGCIWAALEQEVRHEELKGERATVNDIKVGARMLAEPQLNENDVWVDRKTDFRWIIHEVKHLVEIRGFPIVYQVELRLAEFSHPVYHIEIQDQVPE
jgi:hypothetical protein